MKGRPRASPFRAHLRNESESYLSTSLSHLLENKHIIIITRYWLIKSSIRIALAQIAPRKIGCDDVEVKSQVQIGDDPLL
jgi:hypothetical protein